MSKTAWHKIQKQALEMLQQLLRLDTTNPPGNERIATDYIRPILERDGIDSIVIESAPTRANLIAKIEGRGARTPDGDPLMISFHTDVVPAEIKNWSRAPFGGEIYQGCVWGRGALDMKNKAAMDIAIFTALRRSGAIPQRDLILAAVADEEAGSDLGAKYLVEQHPDLIRAGYVLNEAGGFTMFFGDRRLYPIQVAEKGYVTVEMTVHGKPGHGSMPRQDNVIVRLSEAITKIAKTPMRERMIPLIRGLLNQLDVPHEGLPPLFNALLSNTVSATIIRGGYKDNVIPGQASVILDGRTLPGDDPESFMAELRSIVGPEPSFRLLKTAPPAEASPDTPLFDLITRKVETADPGAHAVAWMIPGATDNKFYARLGAVCYGFSPVKLTPHLPFGSLFHGNDERIPVDGFLWGLRVYAEVVLEFLGLKFAEVFE